MSLEGARLARAAADAGQSERPTGHASSPARSARSTSRSRSRPRSRIPRTAPSPSTTYRRHTRSRSRAAGWRRRPPADRDDLRHAEREGRDRGRSRGRAGAPALALVHRNRQERPQPLRTDLGRVLDLRRARRAVRRRRQLLARRDRDAAVPRGAREHRFDVRLLPSERGAAECARAPRRAGRAIRAGTCARSPRTGS